MYGHAVVRIFKVLKIFFQGNISFEKSILHLCSTGMKQIYRDESIALVDPVFDHAIHTTELASNLASFILLCHYVVSKRELDDCLWSLFLLHIYIANSPPEWDYCVMLSWILREKSQACILLTSKVKYNNALLYFWGTVRCEIQEKICLTKSKYHACFFLYMRYSHRKFLKEE